MTTRRTRTEMRKLNLAKLRRAALNPNAVVRFSYRAVSSETGEAFQTPVVKVVDIDQDSQGRFFFRGINLNRIVPGRNVDAATRNYRLDRVSGSITRVV